VLVELSANETAATDQIRPDAAASRSANRHADDDVADQVDHAVIAELSGRPEETRVVAEVHFAADDAVAHGARAHAVRATAVVAAAGGGRSRSTEARTRRRAPASARGRRPWRQPPRAI